MGKIGIEHDKAIHQLEAYKKFPWFLRRDVYPFAFAYSVAYSAAWQEPPDTGVLHPSFFVLPVLLGLHLIVFLFCQWRVGVRCWVSYQPVNCLEEAEFIRVIPHPNHGTEDVVSLCRDHLRDSNVEPLEVAGQQFRQARAWFEFEKAVFCFFGQTTKTKQANDEYAQQLFQRLEYPVSCPLDGYAESSGHSKMDRLSRAAERWGMNSLYIPTTPFLTLFQDHLIAPFFVFQVLCVLLWMLDEYWYYSLWTLVMLLVFEAAVCKQRQASLEFVRQMRRRPYEIFVYRLCTWQLISTVELLPGDICSVRVEGPAGGAPSPKLLSTYEEEASLSNDHYVPADLLLLRGTCVVNEAMLTGESIPQIKNAILSQSWEKGENLALGDNADGAHKRSVLFAGTNVIQNSIDANAGGCKVPIPPDRGCIAFVLRTGFETAQGNLMRTILFSQKKMVVGDKDTGLFIAILVVFALAASANVLLTGLEDPRRNRFKLVLHCIMIITTVVPPELPMELSMAVSNSLNALMRQLIYCTEPFRIPFAGRVDVCCFDKTGTLTSDELILLGVAEKCEVDLADDSKDVTLAGDLGASSLSVLAGCNSLVSLQGQLIGDPLEKATLTGINWECQPDGSITPAAGGEDSKGIVGIKILKRFNFSSAKRKMTTIAKVTTKQSEVEEDTPSTNLKASYWVLTKGAPEALEKLYGTTPEGYSNTFLYHMSKGRRVLALGCKQLPEGTSEQALLHMEQQDAEVGLEFAGFLALNCPLKYDTIQVLEELQKSKHRTLMITGDSAFTAADVGRQIGMITRSPEHTLLLGVEGDTLVWNTLQAKQAKSNGKPFMADKVAELTADNDLCVTGDAIAFVVKKYFEGEEGVEPVLTPQAMAILKQLCPSVVVFARMSPSQKEVVISALNACGLVTLMCGDGTNDVGALKRAHCGVSILNCPELEKRVQSMNQEMAVRKKSKASKEKGAVGEVRKRRAAKAEGTADAQNADTSTPIKKKKKRQQLTGMAKLMAEMQEQDRDPRLVRLGDASVASPFTAKRISTDCVLAIVRQGRCTLVTTLQMYKILALNCLIGAYMLSSLFMYGIKQGDFQMVSLGICVALLFFAISRAKPLEKLSSQRPPSRIFCCAVGFSVLGQFIVHLCCLVAAVKLCTEHIPSADDPFLTPDGMFYPNTLNTTIYILSAVIQTNNFAANYTGHPFMQGIKENKLMWYILVAMYITFAIVATESFEPLSDLLQLSIMPNETFRNKFLVILVADTVCTLGLEKVIRRIFVNS